MMPARWLHHAVRLTGAASVPLLLALVPAGVVHGQTAVAPEDVAAIARSLNCPLCQGYNLQDCPLEVCAQMRETIRQKLEVGVTPDQIVADFVADYGPQVLSAPPRSGWMASAWLVPPIVLLLLALGRPGWWR
jgi:cytochrome c-type biogenesis protein CcmH